MDARATDVDVPDSATDLPETSSPSVVALDAIGPDTTGTGGSGKASPITWTHTTAGANRALFVSVTIGSSPDAGVEIGSVTFEGAALTKIATEHSHDKDAGYVTMWVLTNPAAGSHPISVAFTGAPDAITAGSISFTGVDQSAPYQNLTTASGDSSNPKVEVSSAARNMVVAALVSGCKINTSGQTLGWLKNVNCGTGGGNGGESVKAGAPTVSITYSIDLDWWGLVGVDVKAATP